MDIELWKVERQEVQARRGSGIFPKSTTMVRTGNNGSIWGHFAPVPANPTRTAGDEEVAGGQDNEPREVQETSVLDVDAKPFVEYSLQESAKVKVKAARDFNCLSEFFACRSLSMSSMPDIMSTDDNDDSIDSAADVFAVSEDLVQSPTHRQASTGVVDFDGLLASTPLKLHEDLSGGNGGQAWPAGRVLAKYLLRYKQEELKKASIVELGAGGGLVGLAVALGCPLENVLHLTDQLPMLALMQRNVELNQLGGRVLPVVYDWGVARPEAIPEQPDIILAADCVYFEPAFPLLQQTLQDLIGEKSVCYFCFKKRRRADMQFMRTAKKMFDIREITDDADQAVYARENIHLCEIRKKRGQE